MQKVKRILFYIWKRAEKMDKGKEEKEGEIVIMKFFGKMSRFLNFLSDGLTIQR